MKRFSVCVAVVCLLAAFSPAVSASSSGNGISGITTESNSSSPGVHHGTAHVHASAQEIGFLTICIFIGVVSRKCIEPKLCMNFVPYTVILLFLGAIIGMISIFSQFDDSKGTTNRYCHMSQAELVAHDYDPDLGCNANFSHDQCACTDTWGGAQVNILHNLSPHVILFVFLPPLIFESAFFTDFHIFVRSMVGVS